jgi:thioredoxin 1
MTPQIILELDDTSFLDFVEEPGKKALEFYLPGCAPCRAVELLFKQLAPKYPGVRFARIDITANEKAWEAMGIGEFKVAPVVIFMDGSELDGKLGAVSREECIAYLNRLESGEINAKR